MRGGRAGSAACGIAGVAVRAALAAAAKLEACHSTLAPSRCRTCTSILPPAEQQEALAASQAELHARQRKLQELQEQLSAQQQQVEEQQAELDQREGQQEQQATKLQVLKAQGACRGGCAGWCGVVRSRERSTRRAVRGKASLVEGSGRLGCGRACTCAAARYWGAAPHWGWRSKLLPFTPALLCTAGEEQRRCGGRGARQGRGTGAGSRQAKAGV